MPCDYSIYPPDWPERRRRILERAGNCCEGCGLPNHSYVNRITRELCLQDEDEAIKIVLTIAHLDHDPQNWNVEDERLRAWCQKCHNAYDARERRKHMREKREALVNQGVLL